MKGWRFAVALCLAAAAAMAAGLAFRIFAVHRQWNLPTFELSECPKGSISAREISAFG